MLEKLWNDIRLIYEGYNYPQRLLINDLLIVSNDNFYLLYYRPDNDKDPMQIRIEKNYSLVNMWSDNKEVDITYYNIHVEVGDQVYTSENSMIELTYKIITPFLRELKLNKIGL
jgi:hypothetical protein